MPCSLLKETKKLQSFWVDIICLDSFYVCRLHFWKRAWCWKRLKQWFSTWWSRPPEGSWTIFGGPRADVLCAHLYSNWFIRV